MFRQTRADMLATLRFPTIVEQWEDHQIWKCSTHEWDVELNQHYQGQVKVTQFYHMVGKRFYFCYQHVE